MTFVMSSKMALSAVNFAPTGSDSYLNMLRVPKHLIFVKDRNSLSFRATLKIFNQSYNGVSLKVCPLNPAKFTVHPPSGVLSSEISTSISIRTTDLVSSFLDISSELFVVFALPVYKHRSLSSSLQALWEALGSKLLPFETCELHKISPLPRHDSYLDSLSMLDRTSEFLCSRKTLDPRQFSSSSSSKPGFASTINLVFEKPSSKALLFEDWNRLSKNVQFHAAAANNEAWYSIAALFLILALFSGLNYFGSPLFSNSLQDSPDTGEWDWMGSIWKIN